MQEDDDLASRYNAPLQDWYISSAEIQLGRPIGEGYFGRVHEAVYKHMRVCVKILKNVRDGEVANFWKEVGVLAKLRFPHLVQFIGACTDPGSLFIVSELLHCSLHDLLHKHRVRLDIATAVRVGREVALGMNYLHSYNQPIIHRDLSSSNILLDQRLTAKIGDFGLSRPADARISGEGGNLVYMAPEAFLPPQRYSLKSDVYSFGILLWETLAGEPPFRNLTAAQAVVAASRDGARPPISPAWPKALRELLAKCWDTDPAHRPSFASIVVALSELEKHVGPSTMHELPPAVTAQSASHSAAAAAVAAAAQSPLRQFMQEEPALQQGALQPALSPAGAAPAVAAAAAAAAAAADAQQQSPERRGESGESELDMESAALDQRLQELEELGFDAYGALPIYIESEVRQFLAALRHVKPVLGPAIDLQLAHSRARAALAQQAAVTLHPLPSHVARAAIHETSLQRRLSAPSPPPRTLSQHSGSGVEQHVCSSGLQCRWHADAFPRKDEIVMCRVKGVSESDATLELLGYDQLRGMASQSELSRRRIRSMSRILREGERHCMRVLRVDKLQRFVDLTTREVSEAEQEECERRYQQDKAVYLLFSAVAAQLNVCLFCLLSTVCWPLAAQHPSAFEALRLALVNPLAVLRPFSPCDCLKAAAQPPSLFLSPRMLPEVERRCGGSPPPSDVDLSLLGLEVLPRAVTTAPALARSLRSLNLSDNMLATLSPEVSVLTSLEELNCNANRLRDLPRQLALCTRLTRLYLYGNAFERLPEVVCELSKLEWLNLNKNALAELPENIGALEALTELALNHNRLARLPDSFAQLCNLQTLDLSYNEFATFPSPLLSLPVLQTLELQHNQLRVLPSSVGRILSLQILDASWNCLERVSEALLEQLVANASGSGAAASGGGGGGGGGGGLSSGFGSTIGSGYASSPAGSPRYMDSPASPSVASLVLRAGQPGHALPSQPPTLQLQQHVARPRRGSGAFNFNASASATSSPALPPPPNLHRTSSHDERGLLHASPVLVAGGSSSTASEDLAPLLTNLNLSYNPDLRIDPTLLARLRRCPDFAFELEDAELDEGSEDEGYEDEEEEEDAAARERRDDDAATGERLDLFGDFSDDAREAKAPHASRPRTTSQRQPRAAAQGKPQPAHTPRRPGVPRAPAEPSKPTQRTESRPQLEAPVPRAPGSERAPQFASVSPLGSKSRRGPQAARPSSRATETPADPGAGSAMEPRNAATWKPSQVAEWLRSSGFGEHAAAFETQEVDGASLLELDKGDLKDLGVAKLGPQKHLLRIVAELKETVAAAAAAAARKGRAQRRVGDEEEEEEEEEDEDEDEDEDEEQAVGQSGNASDKGDVRRAASSGAAGELYEEDSDGETTQRRPSQAAPTPPPPPPHPPQQPRQGSSRSQTRRLSRTRSAECVNDSASMPTPPPQRTSSASLSQGGVLCEPGYMPSGCEMRQCEVVVSELLRTLRQDAVFTRPHVVRAIVVVTSFADGITGVRSALRAATELEGVVATPFDGLQGGCAKGRVRAACVFPPLYVISVPCLVAEHGVSLCVVAVDLVAAAVAQQGGEFRVLVPPYVTSQKDDDARDEVLKAVSHIA